MNEINTTITITYDGTNWNHIESVLDEMVEIGLIEDYEII